MERIKNLAELKRNYPHRESTFAVLYCRWKSLNSDVTSKMRKLYSDMWCNRSLAEELQPKYEKLAEIRMFTAKQMFRIESMYNIVPFYI